MLASKHGDCAGFHTFETQHGVEAATEVLERLCEELWSRGSQEGVSLLDVEGLDTLGDNHKVEGLVEYKKAWYTVGFHSGSAYGMQVDYFDLEDAAPAQTPDEDCRDLVGAFMTDWRRSCQALSTAGMRSWAQLGREKELARQPLLSFQPGQVHQLIKPVLADLALPHEDYHLHALKMAKAFLGARKPDARALFAHLSPDFKQVFQAAQQAFEAKHPQENRMAPSSFFARAMEPVVAARIF